MSRLTRRQREALAELVIGEIGTLVEFWSEKIADMPNYRVLAEISPDEAARQFAIWLQRLPSNTWHDLLPRVWEEPK